MDLKNKEDVEAIVEGCKKNDRQYQHLLYKLSYSKMLNVCMRYGKDIEEAKDMLQEGYLRVYGNIASYNYSGSFEGWLTRVFVNSNISQINKKKIKFTENEDYVINNIIEEEEQVADNFLGSINESTISPDKLVELIQELSPNYRCVFNLYYIEDLSHKEIAEKLNISVGTSKSNLARAKVNLKNLFLSKYKN